MKSHYFLFFPFLVLLVVQVCKADIGCMDNSYHAQCCDQVDLKRYHFVECTCPCDKYAHSFNRGRCEKCWHFRIPKSIYVVGESDYR